MSGRPALIRQRAAKQIIAAAKKMGAKQVEFRVRDVPVVVHLADEPVAPDEDVNL